MVERAPEAWFWVDETGLHTFSMSRFSKFESTTPGSKTHKLSFVRQCVAFLLSAREIPHAAGNVEFDVTPVVEYGAYPR